MPAKTLNVIDAILIGSFVYSSTLLYQGVSNEIFYKHQVRRVPFLESFIDMCAIGITISPLIFLGRYSMKYITDI
jgi:hypothetical protein